MDRERDHAQVRPGAVDVEVSGGYDHEAGEGSRVYSSCTGEAAMTGRRWLWVLVVGIVFGGLVAGCFPRAESVVVDPPQSLSKGAWDRFGDGLPGSRDPYGIDSIVYESVGIFDVTLFRQKPVVLPGKVRQIYAVRYDTNGSIAYDVQFSWGSQAGADAQQRLRELIKLFGLVDGKSSIGPTWVGSLRVSDTCEFNVLAKLDGDGGVRSVTSLGIGTGDGPEPPMCD